MENFKLRSTRKPFERNEKRKILFNSVFFLQIFFFKFTNHNLLCDNYNQSYTHYFLNFNGA